MSRATLGCERGAGLSQSLSNGIAPWGREHVNRRDIVSGKLILRWQRGSMVPSPSGTADPIGNISHLYNEFYKSRDTHLILCEAPPAALLSVNAISVPRSGTRSFIRARRCAVLLHSLSRTLLPAPPRRLDPQLSLASEATSLLKPIFLYLHSQLQQGVLWTAKSGVWAVRFRGKNLPFLLLQVLKLDSGKPCCDSVVRLPGVSEPCIMPGRSLWVLRSVSKSSEAWKHPPCWTQDIEHLHLLLKSFDKHQAPSGLALACPSPVYCGSIHITSGLDFFHSWKQGKHYLDMELEKNRDEKFGFVTRYRATFCLLLSGVLRCEKVLQRVLSLQKLCLSCDLYFFPHLSYVALIILLSKASKETSRACSRIPLKFSERVTFGFLGMSERA